MIDHDRARELAAAALDFDLSAEDRRSASWPHLVELRAPVAPSPTASMPMRRALAGLATIDAPDRPPGAGSSMPAPAASPMPRRPMPRDGSPADVPRRVAIRPPFPAIPPRYRWPLVVTTAAVVIVALIGGGLVWRAGPERVRTSPSAVRRRTAPTASGSAAIGRATPRRSSPARRLAASPRDPVADLTADDVAGGVVGLASGFRLTSLDGTPGRRARPTPDRRAADRLLGHARCRRQVRAYHPDRAAHPGCRLPLHAARPLTARGLDRGRSRPISRCGSSARVPGQHGDGRPARYRASRSPSTRTASSTPPATSTISPRSPAGSSSTAASSRSCPTGPSSRRRSTRSRSHPGIEVGATGERLEQASRFRFETAATDGAPPGHDTFQFSDDLFESATRDRPIDRGLGVPGRRGSRSNAAPPPTSAPIEVYRIAGPRRRDRRFTARSGRSRAGPLCRPRDLVPTAGLTRVVALDARLQDSEGVLWTELPERLPAGWYLVSSRPPRRPIQAILQVTDIAGYLVVSDTKTLLWANDLATGGPRSPAPSPVRGRGPGSARAADGIAARGDPAERRARAPLGSCADPCVPLVTVRDGDRAAFLSRRPDRRDPEGQGQHRMDGSVQRRGLRTGRPSTPTARCIARRTRSTPGASSATATPVDVPEAVTIRLAR